MQRYGGDFPTEYLTLQYRVKDNWGGHNEDPDWGEWMDVPIETVP